MHQVTSSTTPSQTALRLPIQVPPPRHWYPLQRACFKAYPNAEMLPIKRDGQFTDCGDTLFTALMRACATAHFGSALGKLAEIVEAFIGAMDDVALAIRDCKPFPPFDPALACHHEPLREFFAGEFDAHNAGDWIGLAGVVQKALRDACAVTAAVHVAQRVSVGAPAKAGIEETLIQMRSSDGEQSVFARGPAGQKPEEWQKTAERLLVMASKWEAIDDKLYLGDDLWTLFEAHGFVIVKRIIRCGPRW